MDNAENSEHTENAVNVENKDLTPPFSLDPNEMPKVSSVTLDQAVEAIASLPLNDSSLPKITNLTTEQIAQFEPFVDKYVAQGLKTGTIDRDKARAYAKKLYAFVERPDPKVVFVNGPSEAWLAAVWLNNLQQQEGHVPQDDIVIDFEAAREMARGVPVVWPYLDGQFASWLAWIKYMEYIGVKITVDYSLIEEQSEFHIVYPLNSYCIFSERFECVNRKNKVLHCDGGPSVSYLDGSKIWSLNGVSVPQWLAETPWDKIDCALFPTITNAEVRREFIRKVGVERLCTQLGSKVVDKQGDYELHIINLGGATGEWPYLKMLNPSVGCWHMECVGRECTTVEQAIQFRNQSRLAPTQLT